jgi:hypothetical protein
MQGNDVQSNGVQRMTVFPLGELRPRPSWCAGGSHVMDIRGRQGKGNGRHGSNASKPRSSRRRRNGYGVTSRKGRRRNGGYIQVRQARRS